MDDDELITYTEAAALVGVARDTVKQWKSRHDLDPAGWDGRAPLFRAVDVLAADAKVRAVSQGRKRKNAA